MARTEWSLWDLDSCLLLGDGSNHKNRKACVRSHLAALITKNTARAFLSPIVSTGLAHTKTLDIMGGARISFGHFFEVEIISEK